MVSTFLCKSKVSLLDKRFKIFLNYIVGPIVFIWLVLSIYQQIEQQKDLPQTWNRLLRSFTCQQWCQFLLVIILMFINWGLETRKWQFLIRDIQKISFLRAYRAILSGQAFAFNTINGVGEYAGRVVYLEGGNRIRAIAVTLIGSLSQLITTFFMGLSGLLYMRLFLLDKIHYLKGLPVILLDGLMWALFVGMILLIALYFSLSWVTKAVERIHFVSKYAYFIRNVEDFTNKQLVRILLLSFLRYIVFVLQYLLLLQIFAVHGPWLSLAWLVCVLFLVLAIVPGITLAELGLRGAVSIQLFGLLSTNLVGIVFTATGIWLINRMLPAIAGSLLILGIKLFKK